MDTIFEKAISYNKENLEKVAECLLVSRCETYQECLAWARVRFQEVFHDKIAQLTYTFPEDAVTSTGSPFWSAPPPRPRRGPCRRR